MKPAALVVAALLFSTSACLAQTPGAGAGPTMSPEDQKWLAYSAHDSQGEIQLCILAEKHAQSLAVRAFARLMVNDHIAIESELGVLTSGHPNLLPNDIGEDSQKTMNKLLPLQGAEFDREFIAAQVKDHTDDLKKYQKEMDSTQDVDVRRYATMTRLLLQEHLALAKAVQTQLQSGAQ